MLVIIRYIKKWDNSGAGGIGIIGKAHASRISIRTVITRSSKKSRRSIGRRRRRNNSSDKEGYKSKHSTYRV